MYPTSTVVTSITTDRIRRANRSDAGQAAPRGRSYLPPNRALRIAFLGLR
jgi:hypothetical protein